jgi:Domain of unknown function (DUF5666)
MIRLSTILLTLMLSLTVSAANAGVCNAGVGGTGVSQDGIGGTGIINKGIGGTGDTANSGVGGTGVSPNKGIGGTGNTANSGVGGTGIVGVITGFASVCVNGEEVLYDNATKVDVDGQPANISALEVGQLVAIDSNNLGNALKASRISVSHLMIGEIQQINLADNTIQMMGKTINLAATINSKGLKINNLAKNQTLKLSGMVATNGQIFVSRIDVALKNTPTSISGVIDLAGRVNGIKIAQSKQFKPLNSGSLVTIVGEWNGSALQIKQMKENVVQRVLRDNADVIIQGVVSNHSNQIRLDHFDVATDNKTKIKGDESLINQSVIIRGKLNSIGKLNASSIEYSPSNKILDRGGNLRPALPDSKPNDLKPENLDKDHSKNDVNPIEKNPVEKVETNNRPEKQDTFSKPDAAPRPDKVEKPESIEKPTKIDKPETIEKPAKIEKSETFSKPEIIEKPIKIEKPEVLSKPEIVEKPIKIEKPELIEKPISIEKPEVFSKPQSIEKPITFEKPETTERPRH